MAKQRYWGDVKEGDEIPAIQKIATTLMLVKWAGASGDFNPLHWDKVFSEPQVGDPIVHGALKRSWLAQLVTSYAGDEGWVRKFSCQHRGMDWPRYMKTMTEPLDGETWTVGGVVTKKYVEGDDHLVDCDIWVQNGKGETTCPGKATIILPSKGAR